MGSEIKLPEWAYVEVTAQEKEPAKNAVPHYSPILDELGFLSSTDCAFMTDIFNRFPRVRDGFNHFMGFEPEERLAEAVKKLKTEPRAGWPLMGVPPEMIQSVAGHHADGMKLAFMIAAKNIDAQHVSRMIAVHDLAEAVTGDFISSGAYKDPITKAEKQKLERIAMTMLTRDFPDEDVAQEIMALWEEYEAGQTADSVMAHDIDKLELVMQAQYYEALYPDLKPAFRELWDAADRGIKTPEGRTWLTDLTRQARPHPLKTQGRQVFTFPWEL